MHYHPLDVAPELYMAGGLSGPRPCGDEMVIKAHMHSVEAPADPTAACVVYQHPRRPIVAELWATGSVWYGVH